MTTTAAGSHRPHRAALLQAVDIYRDALRPFLVRHLRRAPGRRGVAEAIRYALKDRRADEFDRSMAQNGQVEDAIDVNDFPLLVQAYWREVFQGEFDGNHSVKNAMWMVNDARNMVSHPGTTDLEYDFVTTRLSLIAEVLGRINAPAEQQAVQELRSGLEAAAVPPAAPATAPLPIPPGAAAPKAPSSGAETAPTGRRPGRIAAHLKPWRQVIRPNHDVAQGSYQQAEFAADLQQVYDGRAAETQYGNPVSFFQHTYITPGLRSLLVNAVRRLGGQGGDPVVQTKTGFGGGKTHSLIALYHLVNHADAILNPAQDAGANSRTAAEIRGIFEEAGFAENPAGLGQLAVLVGTFLSRTAGERKTANGAPLNTLWGEMAYQLGGQRAYDLIGAAARRGTAPGGVELDSLFEHIGPCVILIDELVAYVRNTRGDDRDSVITFMQALTESARRCPNVCLVVTLPESEAEAGGEAGLAALSQLTNLLGRIEAVWEPLAIHEAYEVVRRRLFEEVAEPETRDAVCEAFHRMYSNARREYPQGVAEPNYLELLKACYPIHPEIFNRLYEDWSSIPDFQRTRAVLRLMAQGINRLCSDDNQSPLLLPGDLPLTDEALTNEFTRLLPGNWGPVLSEADGPNSRADGLDQGSAAFRDMGGAARRIARAVFLGSAPGRALRGLDRRQIHLGVAQPGQGVSAYNDAMDAMTGALYYFYRADDLYFFHSEENLNKVAIDRAGALSEGRLHREIWQRLEKARPAGQNFIVLQAETEEVPEAEVVRLVALPPQFTRPTRQTEPDEAGPLALKILRERSPGVPRIRCNTLLFLTARSDDMRALERETRRFLAWNSIISGETRLLNLQGDRLGEAAEALRRADTAVSAALVRAYNRTLAPFQLNPQVAHYELTETRIEIGSEGEIFRQAFQTLQASETVNAAISPRALLRLLQEYVWSRQETPTHQDKGQLWTMLTSYVYMPRLLDESALEQCLAQGVEEGAFGLADSYDRETGSYINLRFGPAAGTAPGGIGAIQPGLIVPAAIASAQIQAEREAQREREGQTGVGDDPALPAYLLPGGYGQPGGQTDPEAPPAARRPRRLTARQRMTGSIDQNAVSDLQQEIVRNLQQAGASSIDIEITITASHPSGFDDGATRPIRENCQQLGLEFAEEDAV